MVDGDELAVLGPTTGREAMRFRIPETARQLDETGSLPSYTLLRTPDGMLAVAVQPRYGVSAVEGSASAKAYVQRILELHAFRPSGEMVWSARIPGFRGRGAFEVAAGKERLLLVGGLSGFALYDAGGTLLGIRDLDYSSGLIVSDTDGDGTTEFYLIGPSSAACYELGASGEAHGAGS